MSVDKRLIFFFKKNCQCPARPIIRLNRMGFKCLISVQTTHLPRMKKTGREKNYKSPSVDIDKISIPIHFNRMPSWSRMLEMLEKYAITFHRFDQLYYKTKKNALSAFSAIDVGCFVSSVWAWHGISDCCCFFKTEFSCRRTRTCARRGFLRSCEVNI